MNKFYPDYHKDFRLKEKTKCFKICSRCKEINLIKLKTLKKTKNFYLWELKRKESLTESEKSKYLLALKSIKKIIQEKEKHKIAFQTIKNMRRGY